MSRVDELKQRLAAIREAPKFKQYPKADYKGRTISPRKYLDLAASSGLTETSRNKDTSKWEHNTGKYSDLGGVHADLPEIAEYDWERDSIDWSTGKPIITKNKTDFKEKTDTRNKILGTGSDDRPSYRKYDDDREIFRGDELGTVEYLKRKIRSGEPMGTPMLDVKKNKVTQHEGRHRARALMEEGVEKMPVSIFEDDGAHPPTHRKNTPINKLRGQYDSLDEKLKDLKDNEALTGNKITIPRKDTRAPIFGRKAKLKQRLQKVAYKGMGDVRKKGFEQSDNIGYFMHNKFNEPGIRDEIMSNVAESDKTCKNEATCGQSSRVMKKHFDEIAQGSGLRKDDVKEIAGTYTGPGAEHSQAVKYIKDKPVVGHEWLELPDESIVDASAGQFIDQKHGPLKQRHRFRIVPKESGLHKYYKKDKNLQQMIDTPEGREEINKIRKSLGLDTTPKGMKQVKLPNGKIITIPNKYAKLKQRLSRLQQ